VFKLKDEEITKVLPFLALSDDDRRKALERITVRSLGEIDHHASWIEFTARRFHRELGRPDAKEISRGVTVCTQI
jgi:predicted metal-dependent RNase